MSFQGLHGLDYRNVIIVYYKGERMGEARPLDIVANDRKPAPEKVNPTAQANQP